MKSKKSSMATFLLSALFIVSLTAGIVLGAESLSRAPEKPAVTDDIPIGLQRHTLADPWERGSLESFPVFSSLTNLNPFQIDLRSYDISKLDLSNFLEPLLYSNFDSSTLWPDNLPEGFSPQTITEYGKNPGLNIRDLTKMGIDGSGVSIAIIDQVLFTGHSEFADQLVHYEEIPILNHIASMHGNAVASLAVGKSSGVAPNASLYFIASTLLGETQNDITYEYYAQAIHRILDINKQLPETEMIRAITIARGWDSHDAGYDEVKEAIARAKDEGVFVVSTSLENDYGFKFSGLDRDPLADPDDISGYSVGTWIKRHADQLSEALFFPMESRTYASWTGESNFAWGRVGGFSWIVPYITGLYAMCAQVYPDITPEIFWETALATSNSATVDNLGSAYEINHIVNPVRLIDALLNRHSK